MINTKSILLALIIGGIYFSNAVYGQQLIPLRFHFAHTTRDLSKTLYHDGGFLCYPKPQNDIIDSNLYMERINSIFNTNLINAKTRGFDQNIIKYYANRIEAEATRMIYDMETRRYNLITPESYCTFNNYELTIPVYNLKSGLYHYPKMGNSLISTDLYKTACVNILQYNKRILAHKYTALRIIGRYEERVMSEIICNIYDFLAQPIFSIIY